MQGLQEVGDTAANRARSRHIQRKCESGVYGAGDAHVQSPRFALHGGCTQSHHKATPAYGQGVVLRSGGVLAAAMKVPQTIRRANARRDRSLKNEFVRTWLAEAETRVGQSAPASDNHAQGGVQDSVEERETNNSSPGVKDKEVQPQSCETQQEARGTVPLSLLALHDPGSAYDMEKQPCVTVSADKQGRSTHVDRNALVASSGDASVQLGSVAVASKGQVEHVSCDDLAHQCLGNSH